MWMSMTGFGRGERHGEEISVTVEARTVNHRFLDLHMRCPGRFLSWEPRIRGIVRDSVRRGKVDLHVNVREWGKLGAGLRVNDELLRSFLDEAKRIREEHGVGGEVTLRDLLSVPDLFQVAPVEATIPRSSSGRWPRGRSGTPSGCSAAPGRRKGTG